MSKMGKRWWAYHILVGATQLEDLGFAVILKSYDNEKRDDEMMMTVNKADFSYLEIKVQSCWLDPCHRRP